MLASPESWISCNVEITSWRQQLFSLFLCDAQSQSCVCSRLEMTVFFCLRCSLEKHKLDIVLVWVLLKSSCEQPETQEVQGGKLEKCVREEKGPNRCVEELCTYVTGAHFCCGPLATVWIRNIPPGHGKAGEYISWPWTLSSFRSPLIKLNLQIWACPPPKLEKSPGRKTEM